MELVLATATMARFWRAELPAGHRLGLRATITVRPRGGMPMTLRKREPIQGGAKDRKVEVRVMGLPGEKAAIS
jgi:hypothetical protein